MPTQLKTSSITKKVHLLLGGNLGDRVLMLENAVKLIAEHVGEIIIASKLYETAAWGKEDQNAFLNQVLLVESRFSSAEILIKIQHIENKLGRIRFEKWSERLIDIDILFIENEITETSNLIVPHPFIQDRRFTLIPLSEISPDFIHPVFNKSIVDLLSSCADSLEVKPIN